MTANKTVRMIMISDSANNNKYYNMFDDGNGQFRVEYGRVDQSKQTESYPLSKWETKYKEKLRKGYKDVSELFAEQSISSTNKSKTSDFGLSLVSDIDVKSILSDLLACSNRSIQENYTVSSKSVSLKQIEKAQEIVNKLSGIINQTDFQIFNKELLELFAIIPRRMKKVEYHILKDDNLDEKKKIVSQEQSLLDTMKGQVDLNKTSEEADSSVESIQEKSILDNLDIESMKLVSDSTIIQKLKNMMGDSVHMFSRAYEIKHKNTSKRFVDWVEKKSDKKIMELFHGSKSPNWINILQTGLLIRPSNAVATGSMFGDSVYFADRARKSINYTDINGSYWARGTQNKAYLAVFDVHVGKQHQISRWDASCYNLCESVIQSKPGGPYDSVHALAGYDLQNPEFMVYNIAQSTIRYLIEIHS